MTNRVKIWRYFQGLTIDTINFALEVKFVLSSNYTFTGVGGVGGAELFNTKANLSPRLGFGSGLEMSLAMFIENLQGK